MECRYYNYSSLKQRRLNKILARKVIYWLKLAAGFLMEHYRVILLSLKLTQK